MKPNLYHPELGFYIVSCAFKVHNTLMSGLPEKTYQLVIATEFAKQEIPFLEYYCSNTLYNTRKIHMNFSDFLVYDLITVELKSCSGILITNFKQKQDLLTPEKRGFCYFGIEQLTFKRVLNCY